MALALGDEEGEVRVHVDVFLAKGLRTEPVKGRDGKALKTHASRRRRRRRIEYREGWRDGWREKREDALL